MTSLVSPLSKRYVMLRKQGAAVDGTDGGDIGGGETDCISERYDG